MENGIIEIRKYGVDKGRRWLLNVYEYDDPGGDLILTFVRAHDKSTLIKMNAPYVYVLKDGLLTWSIRSYEPFLYKYFEGMINKS